MPRRRTASLTYRPVLALAAVACASQPGAVPPEAAFPSVAAAMACAREALASAGFLPQAQLEPPPGQAGIGSPAETPTSVTRQIITPLGEGRQVDFVGADARVQVGPRQDTTVTLSVRAGTLVAGGQHNAAEVRPLSAFAARGRDAVVTRCHATTAGAVYPRSS